METTALLGPKAKSLALDDCLTGMSSVEKRAAGRGSVDDPPVLTAEGAVGAVLSVIHARLLEQNTERSTCLR
jgi:hypothetical protein